MKAKLIENEITQYRKSIEIEVDGVTYYAKIYYDSHDGYDLQFHTKDGVNIPYPDWAEYYDNANRWLTGDLDGLTGSYKCVQEEQVLVSTGSEEK